MIKTVLVIMGIMVLAMILAMVLPVKYINKHKYKDPKVPNSGKRLSGEDPNFDIKINKKDNKNI